MTNTYEKNGHIIGFSGKCVFCGGPDEFEDINKEIPIGHSDLCAIVIGEYCDCKVDEE